MRRSLLVLVSLLALAPIAPVAAAEEMPLTNGAYTSTGECDFGGCAGTKVFDGTFAVGGVEITDVATFEWSGDDEPPYTFAGPLVGEHLVGVCTIDESPPGELDEAMQGVVPVALAIPAHDGTMTCDVSVDGGAAQTFSFALVMTGSEEDGPFGRPTVHGRFLGI